MIFYLIIAMIFCNITKVWERKGHALCIKLYAWLPSEQSTRRKDPNAPPCYDTSYAHFLICLTIPYSLYQTLCVYVFLREVKLLAQKFTTPLIIRMYWVDFNFIFGLKKVTGPGVFTANGIQFTKSTEEKILMWHSIVRIPQQPIFFSL